MGTRCACVSMGGGPMPPTGSGSGPMPPTGSGPNPPTGSGSGSGPQPPTGSGSGNTPAPPPGPTIANPGSAASTTTFKIRQTWSQETDYDRTAEVSIPATSAGEKVPVVIHLHGNGGQGNTNVLGSWLGDIAVIVSATGYERSWNVVKEKSKADDVSFILDLIAKVGAEIPAADMNNVAILGTSNGAALTYRLMIENVISLHLESSQWYHLWSLHNTETASSGSQLPLQHQESQMFMTLLWFQNLPMILSTCTSMALRMDSSNMRDNLLDLHFLDQLT